MEIVSELGVGQNQLPDTDNQIPTGNSGTGTGSGYAIAGCRGLDFLTLFFIYFMNTEKCHELNKDITD